MGEFETGNQLAILTASRNINWQDQPAYTPILAGAFTSGLPASAAAGVELGDVVKALVSVAVREAIHKRSARITVPVHDATTTYIVTIAGTPLSHVVGGDTRGDQAIRGLVALINASVPLNSIATAVALNAAGEDVTAIAYDAASSDTVTATAAVTILTSGVNEDHWTLAGSVSGGTGSIAMVADPQSCSIRVYATRKLTTGSSEWAKIPNSGLALDHTGFMDRFTVNGLKRLAVEVYDCVAAGDGSAVTYAPAVVIGPAILE